MLKHRVFIMPEKEFAAYALIICVTAILKIVVFARNGVSEHPFMKWLLSVPIVEKFIHEKISEQK